MTDSDDEAQEGLERLLGGKVKDSLTNLTPGEALDLREKFGIELSDDTDLEEIGKQFEGTRAKIREIEKKMR